MILFKPLTHLSLLILISATAVPEKNDTSRTLLEKKSGDLPNELPVKVLPQYDEAIHGLGKAFRMLGPTVESFNRKLNPISISLSPS